MGRHRAPRRRGHPETPPPPPAADHPPTDPEITEPPWLRLVHPHEDPLAEPPVDLLPPDPEVQVVYPSGERVRVPIVDGMLIHLSFINGLPQIGVKLA